MNGCCFGGPSAQAWAVSFPADSLPYLRQVERGLLYGIQVGADSSPDPATDQAPAARPVLQWVRPDLASAGLQAGDHIVRIDSRVNPSVGEVWQHLQQIGPAGVLRLVTDRDPAEKVFPASLPPAHSIPVHPTQIYSSINAFLLCLLLLAYYPLRRRDGEVFALLLTLYPLTRFLLEIIRTDELAVFGTRMSISQNVSILFLLGVLALWGYLFRQPAGRLWSATSRPGGSRAGR
ncbi:MAG: hypothetical protein GTO03_01220 [Planctomycetales bacterium]|nr:hypothetical protein [Planctomycetales bacterium]